MVVRLNDNGFQREERVMFAGGAGRSGSALGMGSETPRREAVRTLSAAGAALLGALGQGAVGEGKGKGKPARQQPGAAKKKKKKGKKTSISVTAAYGDPFNLAAGESSVKFVSCPAGFVAIGGGVDTDSIDNCAIQESGSSDVGEWFINLTCSATSSATNARALAVCMKGVTVV